MAAVKLGTLTKLELFFVLPELASIVRANAGDFMRYRAVPPDILSARSVEAHSA
jgi:hypothetical protein